SPPCAQAGAAPALPYWPGRAVPPGSLEAGAVTLGFPRNLGASYAAIRGSPFARNRSPGYLEPRRCECRLDRLMGLRLLASPPVWEYEPGSFTASSLVTPGPPTLAPGTPACGSRLKDWFLTVPTPPPIAVWESRGALVPSPGSFLRRGRHGQ